MTNYLFTLKKYRLLIILPILIVPLVLAFLINPNPNYTGRAGLWLDSTLNIDTTTNPDTPPVDLLNDNSQSYYNYITNLIATREFGNDLISGIEKKGYKLSATLRKRTLDFLYFYLKPTVVGPHLVWLEYQAGDPQFTIALLQTAIELFNSKIDQTYINDSNGILIYLNTQVEQAKIELDRSQSQFHQFLDSHPSLNNLNTGTAFLSEEELQNQINLENLKQAQSRYNLLNERLEQLKINVDNISKNQKSLIIIKDAPAIINATTYDSLSRLILGVGFGFISGSLISFLLLFFLNWGSNGLNEGRNIREIVPANFVIEFPNRKSKFKNNLKFLNRDLWKILLVLVALSGFVVSIITLSVQQPINAILIPGVILLLAVILRSPLFGFGLALLLLISCEIFPSPDGFSTFTTIPVRNFNSFTTIPLSITPVEVIVIWTIFSIFLQTINSNKVIIHRSITTALVGLFTLFIAFGFVWGMVIKQGDSKAALVEVRAPIYLILFYFLATYFFRNNTAWKMLDRIIPVSLTLLSLTIIARLFVFGNFNQSELASDSISGFNHDNAIFLVIFVMWCLNKVVFGINSQQRLSGIFLIILPIFSILVSGRRAAFASLAACLIVFLLVLFKKNRKAFFITAVLLLIIGPPYLIIFKDDTGPLGLGARAFSSSSAPVGSRDYNSDLYRVIEKNNVRLTIREEPFLSKGFGQQFTRYTQLVNLEVFTYQYFTPHVQVLWLWLKVGLGGWIVFWLLICGALFQLGQLLKHNYQQPKFNLAVVGGYIVTAIMVFAYLDITLVDTRVMTLLGIGIGLLEIGYKNLVESALKPKPSEKLSQSEVEIEELKELTLVS